MTAESAPAALAPVRQRLRRDAEERAAQLRAAAREQAAQIVREARENAAVVLGKAESEAAATAAPVTAAELRQARDAARAAVLAAQHQAYDDLRMRVRGAVSSLPGQPGYDRLMQRLTRLAEQVAGPGAQLESPPAGGVLARSDGIVVDCSLVRLADLAVTELGAAVRELWMP